MAEAQARQLFAQLLDGLAYCHTQGVFHRDLRIEHVLLSGRCLPTQAPMPVIWHVTTCHLMCYAC